MTPTGAGPAGSARVGGGAAALDPLLVAVCFAVLTLPIEISGLLFPTTLINLSRLGMLAAMGIVAWRIAVRRERPRVPPAGLLLAALAVLAIDAASVLLTRWPNGVRELAATLFYAGFAFTVLQAVTDRRRLVVVAGCLVAAAAAEALLVVLQQAFDFYLTEIRDMAGRRNGTFIDPNITARFLLLGIAATVVGARRAFRLALPLAAGLGALLTVGLVLTFSRSGWLLLGVVVLVAALASLRDRRALLATATVALTFVVCLVAVPNALHRATDVPGPEGGALPGPAIASLSIPDAWRVDPSADGVSASTPLDGLLQALPLDPIRRYLARGAVAMFMDHPLAGVGLGGYQPMLLGPYVEYIPEAYRDRRISLAHTDALRIAAEEGLVGLAGLAAFLGAIVLAARRLRRTAGPAGRDALLAVALGLVVVVAAAQTEGRLYNDPWFWLLAGVLAALAARGTLAGPMPADG